jgi:hypothetical protein
VQREIKYGSIEEVLGYLDKEVGPWKIYSLGKDIGTGKKTGVKIMGPGYRIFTTSMRDGHRYVIKAMLEIDQADTQTMFMLRHPEVYK